MRAIIGALRRTVQSVSLLGFNAYFLDFKRVCAPVFNCHSCPLAVFACPIGVFVNFGMLHLVPLVAIGIVGLAGVLGGRIFCGWLCPFGFLQDLLHKIPSKKFRLPAWLLHAKYVALAGMVMVIPLVLPESILVFCRLCPAGTLESSIPWRFMTPSWTWSGMFIARLVVLVAVLVGAVLVSRVFCRLACPLGAILSVFNRFSLVRLKVTVTCNQCGLCVKQCPMEIHPVNQLNSVECIRCLECTKDTHITLGVE